MSHTGMRIVILSDAQPGRNGVGTYYEDLRAHLAGHGTRVTLLAPGVADARDQWLSLPLPGDDTQRLALPSPIRLRRRLHALAPHAVIVATPGPYGMLGARYARAVDARLIVGMHTHLEALSTLYWGAILGRLNRWGLAALNRRLCRRADCVVANSTEMADVAEHCGALRTRLVGTLLPRDFLDAPLEPRGDRLERAVFVGRLAAEKRVEQVIEAAERLPEVAFAIAGDGPLRAGVEQAARRLPNLHYLGWLPRAQIRAAIDASDLLLLPSSVEAFGTVAMEAMARGRGALVSGDCGIRDWPGLAQGLWTIGVDEHVADAIARVGALDGRMRRERVRAAREAVLAMNERALREWLAILQPGTLAAAA